MSEMEVTEAENGCSNDLLLLDRVFLRLGNADTDEQLESCLNRFLPPVILKLSSPHEQVRTKVMELLVHVNKRVKCRADVKLPVETLLNLYTGPTANSFIINFCIIYITMGFPRMSKPEQVTLAPALFNAIENKPQAHQDSILMLLMPLLGSVKAECLRPAVRPLLLRLATDVLLLPYRALPSDNQSEFQVPPGFSLRSYRRLVDKHALSPERLEEMKLSIVTFISAALDPAGAGAGGAGLAAAEALLPLTVAAADSRFAVANAANSPLIRAASSVDWSSAAALAPLYALYLGSPARPAAAGAAAGAAGAAAAERRAPACTRLRLKLIQYLNRSAGAAVMFPQCVQVVFTSLFEPNSNPRLRNLALVYLLNVINNGAAAALAQVGPVFLQGLLKLIKSEDYAEHHAKAYQCLGKLTQRSPGTASLGLLEQLVARVPSAEPELRAALRGALLDMAAALRVHGDDTPASADAMEMDQAAEKAGAGADGGGASPGTKKAKLSPGEEPQALALVALLDHYLHSDESTVRLVGARYAAAALPPGPPAAYLLLLASGDSQDEISSEALKCLYGTSRPGAIDDVVNRVDARDARGARDDPTPALHVPPFDDMVEYIWEQMQKRKSGSNAKHRFVVSNQVLPFHPKTYQEMLRYLRLCLHVAAGVRGAGAPPHAASPLLTRLLRARLDRPPLQHYLALAAALLPACPEIIPLTCLLDAAGAAGAAAAAAAPLRPRLRALLDCARADVRRAAAALLALVTVETCDEAAVEAEVVALVGVARGERALETRAGGAAAAAALCDRALRAARPAAPSAPAAAWPPHRLVVECLAELVSSGQAVLAEAGLRGLALLLRSAPLPLPALAPPHAAAPAAADPFCVAGPAPADADADAELSKFSLVRRLFAAARDARRAARLRERALRALGLVCCAERFPFDRHIAESFLMMAKDSKEFEVHLEIGAALARVAAGPDADETRDRWTELPREAAAAESGEAAAEAAAEGPGETDELLGWLLERLLELSREPHPHSRQATCVWLLALVRRCGARAPLRERLPRLQDAFMDLLAENSDIVQDVASKGLSAVYARADAARRGALVEAVIDTLTSGARAAPRVAADTRVFEEGQLGQAPTGGNLSTYKELCALASDLNQPDLLYKFMHLAHHNSVWNSKKGAAFGFQSIAEQAGSALSVHLPRIVPRLFRYRCDPTPRVQLAMTSIWHALVPDTHATVNLYYAEILADVQQSLGSRQWRVRLAAAAALAELLRAGGARRAAAAAAAGGLAPLLPALFRVMDDVHEGARRAAAAAAQLLLKMCVRATEAPGEGRALLAAVLPVLLDSGITHVVKEVRAVSLQTVSKLAGAAGGALQPHLPALVPALLAAAGELEPPQLSHLSTALGDHASRRALDDLRAAAARDHHSTETIVKCMPLLDAAQLAEMLPQVLELARAPQLGSRVAACHFLTLAAHALRGQLGPLAGRAALALLPGALDRSAAVRRHHAEALAQLTAYAKPAAAEKVLKKLVAAGEAAGDEAAARGAALALRAVGAARPELLRLHEPLVAPLVFLAMHGDKDDESSPAALYGELWAETSGGAGGARRLLPALLPRLEEALADPSWPRKVQAAGAVQTLAALLPGELGEARARLVRALLAAVRGKTFDGKQRLLQALADICSVELGAALAEEAAAALLGECRRAGPGYRRAALAALAAALPALQLDRFDQLYDVVKLILSKDASGRDSDSDSEAGAAGASGGAARAEAARARREQLVALQDAAYDLLGQAWPDAQATQDKYQDIFFEHCSRAYAAHARSTQLAILTAMGRVLARLRALSPAAGAGAGAGAAAGAGPDVVARVTDHVVCVADYTFKNNNQVRHRREALNLIEILVKKLKELNRAEEVQVLRALFASHVQDLSKEDSHEIRSKVDNIKVYFK